MICETSKNVVYRCDDCRLVFHQGMIIRDKFTQTDSCPECGCEDISCIKGKSSFTYVG